MYLRCEPSPASSIVDPGVISLATRSWPAPPCRAPHTRAVPQSLIAISAASEALRASISSASSSRSPGVASHE